jgi:glycosyltransferase involved in cell wall biosynthesis
LLTATHSNGRARLREIARHNLNGLLVPLRDVGALAQAINRLATDADLRRKFGQASRKLVEQEFSSNGLVAI